MQTAKSSMLSPLYYLNNFLTLLDSVECHYKDLLTPDELDLLTRFRSLTKHGQALMVRLYSRRGRLFRSDKLCYPELVDLAKLTSELERAEFIERNPALGMEDLLNLATCKEIRHWWSDRLQSSAANIHKAALVKVLCCTAADQYYQRVPFTVIWVQHREWTELLLLLFFGHSGQDLSTFITAELGYAHYENYPLASKDRLFRKRVDIDHALQIMQLRASLDNLETIDAEVGLQLLSQLPAVAWESPLRYRHDRLCNRLGKALEKAGADELALQSYEKSVLPPSRERRARIHLKQGNTRRALFLCKEMLQQPLSEAEIQFATFFTSRCLKKRDVKMAAKKRFQPVIETIPLERDCQSGTKVEALVSQWLMETTGGICFYTENWLFNAVFGLTFWQAIFDNITGAFTHPFQSRPHDLYEPTFCNKREDQIACAFAKISTKSWPDVLRRIWLQKYGIRNPFVSWNPEGWPVIATALERIPTHDWRIVFQRMLRDLRNHCSGFPDLIHFPESGSYRLLEVKSPTDKVQPNQLRWMQYFHQQKIPYGLLQVKWNSAPS